MRQTCHLLLASILLGLSAPLGAQSNGTLFIIGGGDRPEPMRRELIRLSGLDRGNYAVILPMSSAEPDSSIFYARQQFTELGIPAHKISGFQLNASYCPPVLLDSIVHAGLVYITGGDQVRFMAAVKDSPIQAAIRKAYERGAVVAGTSAGAAVMSERMITGEQIKYPEQGGYYRQIESGNVEISQGLGFLPSVIIDQHFVYRMRLNRLIAAVLEYPDKLGIGIDEATAIVVQGRQVRVLGDSQVVLVRQKKGKQPASKGHLLGSRHLQLQVLLPGDTFTL